MKVEFYMYTGFSNTEYKNVFEFDDDTSDEDIEASLEDWKNDRIDYGWRIVND